MYMVTPSQMRIIEDNSEKCGVLKHKLMLNAGYRLAEFIHAHGKYNINKKVVFLAGTGNNAGDCFVSAEFLKKMGYNNVTVVLVYGMPKTQLAKYMYDDIKKIINITNDVKYIKDADIIVDGVFGTGFHGEIEKRIADIFMINPEALRIAVDIPSGVNGLTGETSEGAFKADATLTFGFIKAGMTQYPARKYCGKVTIADIGIPVKAMRLPKNDRKYMIIEKKELKNFPPERKGDTHKGDFGKVLVIAGSNTMRGAPFFAVSGALRSGAGLVQLATTAKCIDTVSMLAPEAIFIEMPSKNGFMQLNMQLINLKKYDSIVIGCGMGVTPETINLTKYVIENSQVPVIIDADGINCIASDIDILLKKRADIIITPHVAEMARLMKKPVQYVAENRFMCAEQLAEQYNITVLLKGSGTVIADNRRTAVNSTGNAGMSRGGSGDILSGIIGAIAGQGYNAFKSACAGAYIHGLAGDMASDKFTPEAMLPRDIVNCLTDSFRVIK